MVIANWSHRKRILLLLGALAAVAGFQAQSASAQAVLEKEPETKDKAEAKLGETWVQLTEDDDGTPLALEVAIVRYTRPQLAKQPPERLREYVDLVGAIHIGDRRYYTKLNRRFKQYDALLYELVAPEGTVVEKGRGSSNLHPLGAMQNGMKTMLEIEHQLEQIDYTKRNFVHADFSPEEFSQSMEDRDEGWVQLYFKMVGQALAQQSEQAAKGNSTDIDIFTALLSDDRARRLKIALAKQFESMEAMLSGLSGPDGSTLITERNKKALEVLRREMKAGKRKLGIFYGAGHLSDMHERLDKDFGLVPVSIEWLEAWDLREK